MPIRSRHPDHSLRVPAVLGPYAHYGSVWIEITRADHGHGGPGWEFGSFLWSPARDRAHHDRYAVMREPLPGDLVLHLLHAAWPDGRRESRLCGSSLVARPAEAVGSEPPSPGDWAGFDAYYRIPLRGYAAFPQSVPFPTLRECYGEAIRREIVEVRPRLYPFATYGETIRTAQGRYLARCTEALYLLLRDALGLEEVGAAAGREQPALLHREYAEGMRAARERFFFTRNAALARDAKAFYGLVCQACGFDFARRYGDLGAGYIECHHLNPLSERSEHEWSEGIRSRLDEVRVLCANCHRMIHRRRPALSFEELRGIVAGGEDAARPA